MRKFNLNWGVSLALIVLLAYTYIATMGALYRWEGDVWKAAIFAAAVIVSVSVCVFIMVNAKVSKSKELGFSSQIVFGAIILTVFILSGIPFSSFLEAAGSHKDTQRKIDDIKVKVTALDSVYIKYAEARVEKFRQSLPPGSDLKVQSLQRRLLPDDLDQVQADRHDWVGTIGGMSIWNIRLPKNMDKMKYCVDEWTKNYTDLSSVAYNEEPQPVEPFEYTAVDESLEILLNKFKHPGFSVKTIWVVLVAILATLAMMAPYWLATPTQTRKPGDIVWREQIKRKKKAYQIVLSKNNF